MMNDRINNIRQLILQAEVNPSGRKALAQRIQDRMPALHNAIRLPTSIAPELLIDFSMRYINQVPDFVAAISGIAIESKIASNIDPLLRIATDYFLKAPEIIRNPDSLSAMLEKSYLSHRLLEEINDRFITLCGVPLAPMDMTRANIIAHELIGEPLANDLDQAVLFSAELLLNEYHFTGKDFDHFVQMHKQDNWSTERSRWPCLVEDLAIDLTFNSF